jgi:GDPmannose 4,6-dehydratase
MSRRALILGIGGQDGSYLAEELLDDGYEVAGILRRGVERYENLAAVADRLTLYEHTFLTAQIRYPVAEFEPDEFYNLAGTSFVPSSWGTTKALDDVGFVVAALEAVRTQRPETRFYQACSSEVFGFPPSTPQNEETPMRPLTPYGAAKAHARYLVEIYRRAFDLFAVCGIAYNHESPRRSPEFLPRKVAIAAARGEEVALGDTGARRDWGYAVDYVGAMTLMLRADEPNDFVLATGESHSVAELVERAFAVAGRDWTEYVYWDETLHRGRGEPVGLVGDASRARDLLGWEPSVLFEGLVDRLVEFELAKLEEEAA